MLNKRFINSPSPQNLNFMSKLNTVKPFIFASFAFALLMQFKGQPILHNHINIAFIFILYLNDIFIKKCKKGHINFTADHNAKLNDW